MNAHARAYILRIAAILELNESPIGVRNLVQQLQSDDPTWTAESIAAAVAYVRASLRQIPFTTIRMELEKAA